MRWIMNGKNVARSTIFQLANTDIKIHQIVGYDGYWFLTYRPLDIEWHELNTRNFDEAKKKAIEYIQCVRRMLRNKTEGDKNMLVQAVIEPDEFVKC